MWWFSESQLARAKAVVTKIAKRAAKLGVEAPVLTVGESKMVDPPDSTPSLGAQVEVWQVAVTTPVVRLAGWRFIAKLDSRSTDTALIYTQPGEALTVAERERAQTAPRECDHCKIDRRRKTTYVVEHEDGTRAQVGSTCLRDFLGHDAARHMSLMTMFGKLFADLDEVDASDGDGYCDLAWPLVHVLAFSARAIALWGWVSRGAANPTKPPTVNEVRLALDGSRAGDDLRLAVTESDKAYAEKVIAWAKDLDATNDYLMNLHTLANTGYVGHKPLALAVSAVVAYRKAVEGESRKQEQDERAAKSQHIGEPGKRQSFGPCEVLFKRELEGEWGTTTALKFATQEGAILTWFASGVKDVEVGNTMVVKATVKAHKDYNGCLETQVSRAVIQ